MASKKKSSKRTHSDITPDLEKLERLVADIRNRVAQIEDPEEREDSFQNEIQNELPIATEEVEYTTDGRIKIPKPRRNKLNIDPSLDILGRELRCKREDFRQWNVFNAAQKSDLKSDTVKNLESGKGTIRNLLKYCVGLGCRMKIEIGSDGDIVVEVIPDKI